MAAHAIRDNTSGLPIAVCGSLVDLLQPTCVDVVVATIAEAENKWGCEVGLIVINSWAKALGGSDEDKAREVNVVVANLTSIHDRLAQPVHIATIGHMGKDSTRGERGSIAKRGHFDLNVEIKMAGEIGSATVCKANDQALGPLVSWRTEQIITGEDEDGDAETATILSTQAVAGTGASVKAQARQHVALNALDYAMRDHAQPPPVGVEGPTKVVAVDRWKDELLRLGVIARPDPADPKSSKGRVSFKRLKDGLVAAGVMGDSGCGWIWPNHAGVGYPGMPAAEF